VAGKSLQGLLYKIRVVEKEKETIHPRDIAAFPSVGIEPRANDGTLQSSLVLSVEKRASSYSHF
jgi:hypothetical protein